MNTEADEKLRKCRLHLCTVNAVNTEKPKNANMKRGNV